MVLIVEKGGKTHSCNVGCEYTAVAGPLREQKCGGTRKTRSALRSHRSHRTLLLLLLCANGWMNHSSWLAKDTFVYPLALLARIVLILFGEWQDRTLSIPYTDVDYEVISDAAQLIVTGDSPYGRATYRYSPLLAYLLVPNVLLHRCWGKMVFSLADLVVGKCLQSILTRNGLTSGLSLQYACVWLLNPLSINVSTRGSFDAVTSALVLGVTSALLGDRLGWAAAAYGLVVHLRVYPIIYAPGFALYVARSSLAGMHSVSGDEVKRWAVWKNLFSGRPILFAALSATTFFGCTAACAWVYGNDFVRHALLYHLTRTDNRHNYSIYWYWIYLDYGAPLRWLLGLSSFMPQAIMLVVSAALLHEDLALCVFVQTALFVFFNKVFTGQYITWFMCLAPLVAPHLALGKKTCTLFGSWIFALLCWLFAAWNVEMQGQNMYLALWVGSVLMFATNVVVLNACVQAYRKRRIGQ